MFKSSSLSPLSSFSPRYDSEGKYLGSLPDLATPRWFHSCTSFLTSNGEQVKISTCSLSYVFQALLVAGQQGVAFQHRVVRSIKQEMDKRRRPSKVKNSNHLNQRFHCNCQLIITIIKILTLHVIVNYKIIQTIITTLHIE